MRSIATPGSATRTVGLSVVDQVFSSAANAAVFVLLLRVLPPGQTAEVAFSLLVGQVIAGLSKAAFAETLTFVAPQQRLAWIDRTTNSLAILSVGFLAVWVITLVVVESHVTAYRLSFVGMILAVTAVETMRGSLLVSRMPIRALRLDLFWSTGVVALLIAHRLDGTARVVVVSFALVAIPCLALIGMSRLGSAKQSDRLELPPLLRRKLVAEYLVASLSSPVAFATGATIPGVSALVLRGVQISTGPVNSANLVAAAVLPTIERDRREGSAERHSRPFLLALSLVVTMTYLGAAGLVVCTFDVFGEGPTATLCRIWPAVMVLKGADVAAAHFFPAWRASENHRRNLAVRVVGAVGSAATIVVVFVLDQGTGGFVWGMALTRVAQAALWSPDPRMRS